MNISTLAKILGVTVAELRDTGTKNNIYGFTGRNTRIPYNSAQEITKIVRPDRLAKLQNDDRVYLGSTVTVADFSEAIGKAPGIVVRTLVMNGIMATLNEKIDFDTASLIAQELGTEVLPEKGILTEDTPVISSQDITKAFRIEGQGKLISRPPVVTVMGHVDHGKTTLLDTIRKTNVVGSEAGAITQHISSYQITYKDQKITFVDTPGHEAFTAMRSRGSQLADFIILMVSAVEGPKPQTIEVIERAKLSKTPVIVAMNKIDLPNADLERVKQDIAAFGLVPEEWGGTTPFIPISAKNNVGIDKLLDTVLLHAEVAELKGEVDCPGQAVVVESHSDPKIGVLTTVIVSKDTLKIGDFIRCGTEVGKIKKISSSEGKPLTEAHLTEPVEILGLPSLIGTGERIIVYPTQKEAEIAAAAEKAKKSQKRVVIQNNTQANDDGQINVILVADVAGSLEALKESILKIPQDVARIVIKKESIGQVTENDIDFAVLTNSTILAFHTSIHSNASHMMRSAKVNLIESDIIYELLQWVEEEILKHIKHEIKIVLLGKAVVLATFKSEKAQLQIFGGEVKDGKFITGKQLQVVRAGEVVGRLEIVELQRNKSTVSEVNISQQFGISATGKTKVQEGDSIECIDEIIIK